MVEILSIVEINHSESGETVATPPHRHYSEKGGHFLRGAYQRLQSRLEGQFGLYSRSLVPEPVTNTLDWSRRRHMRRIPNSGRSRR